MTKRMISDEIFSSDDFTTMTFQSQALYVQVMLKADNRGFINNIRSICRYLGLNDSNIEELISNRFILKTSMENIYLVKHWYIHNEIPYRLKQDSKYILELKNFYLNSNGSYTDKPTENNAYENLIKRESKREKGKPLKEREIENESEIKIESENEIKENISKVVSKESIKENTPPPQPKEIIIENNGESDYLKEFNSGDKFHKILTSNLNVQEKVKELEKLKEEELTDSLPF